jgi:hypothetical protein
MYLQVPANDRSAAARGLADRYAWDRVVKDFAQALKARARTPCA